MTPMQRLPGSRISAWSIAMIAICFRQNEGVEVVLAAPSHGLWGSNRIQTASRQDASRELSWDLVATDLSEPPSGVLERFVPP